MFKRFSALFVSLTMVLSLTACGGGDSASTDNYQDHLDKAEKHINEIDSILEGASAFLELIVPSAFAQSGKLSPEKEAKVAELMKKSAKEIESAIEAAEKVKKSEKKAKNSDGKKAEKKKDAKTIEVALKKIKNVQKKQATTGKKAAKVVTNAKVKKEVVDTLKTSKENNEDIDKALGEIEAFVNSLKSISDEDLEALEDFVFDIETDLELGEYDDYDFDDFDLDDLEEVDDEELAALLDEYEDFEDDLEDLEDGLEELEDLEAELEELDLELDDLDEEDLDELEEEIDDMEDEMMDEMDDMEDEDKE